MKYTVIGPTIQFRVNGELAKFAMPRDVVRFVVTEMEPRTSRRCAKMKQADEKIGDVDFVISMSVVAPEGRR